MTGIPKASSAVGELVSLPQYGACRMGCSFIPAEPEEIKHKLEDVLNDLQDEEARKSGPLHRGIGTSTTGSMAAKLNARQQFVYRIEILCLLERLNERFRHQFEKNFSVTTARSGL